jgi:sulfite reductase (NADPH) flavoprotein alpha-component
MTTSTQANARAISIPVIPASAPFTAAQRAWLNGFLAGLLNGSAGEPVVEETVAAPQETIAAADEDFPWHDAALSMDERMKLAEERPYPRKLMAAMAQLDCGACGYLCQTYSEAIAAGTEKDLTRCAPGGRETSRKLKELAANPPKAEVTVKGSPVPVPGPAQQGGEKAGSKVFDRNNPFPARLLKCSPLNKPESMKDTRFVALDLKGSGLSYKVGDALGIYPENDPEMVDWIIEALDTTGAEEVIAPDGPKVSLYEALLKYYSLGKPSDLMFELLINRASNSDEASALKELLASDSVAEGDEILDLLRRFPSAKPSPDEFVTALNLLQPRLYSISSSLKAHPDEVHLTMGVVRYCNSRGRQCKGVCSTYFADRIRPGQKSRVFVHASHGFGVPSNGDVPMIMVGPGTGIAPFRAFLQERKATGAMGKNWLFFGDQQRASDFLYETEMETYRQEGLLTRLDLAFSRDQKEKVYVQHRMLENGAEIWKWLQDGAHFYVCGDAKRMACDVDQALKQIVVEQGGMSPEGAKGYLSDLVKAKRYQRDVY